MKNQFTYLINNKTTQGMFILILFIPCIEIVQLYIMLKPDAVNIHPAFAFFLAGSSRGHITQILLLWFLPVLVCYSEQTRPFRNIRQEFVILLLIK